MSLSTNTNSAFRNLTLTVLPSARAKPCVCVKRAGRQRYDSAHGAGCISTLALSHVSAAALRR